MPLFCLLLALCAAAVQGKYSYSDKCYPLAREDHDRTLVYQLYFSKKGIPHSCDYIVYEFVESDGTRLKQSYYYHYDLTCGPKESNTFNCTIYCSSVFYKIWDEEAASNIISSCGTVFNHKYRDIMKYGCTMGSVDIFFVMKTVIGTNTTLDIVMNGDVPMDMEQYKLTCECVWEWDIIGLWSTVALTIIGICVVIYLILFVILFIFAQKHRSYKRQRLDSQLLKTNSETTSV